MNLVERALERLTGAVTSYTTKARHVTEQRPYDARGALTGWTPGALHLYGQPNLSQLRSGISPARMRDIVIKTPTAAAAMNATLDYASGVGVRVRNIDPSQKPPKRAAEFTTELLRNPNGQDTERKFRRKLFRDLFTLGYAAAEMEKDAETGAIANLYVVDSGRLKVDFDQHGRVLGYNMYDKLGKPLVGKDGEHTWGPDEIIWYTLDATSESPYPTSRIEQLFACAVVESLMVAFIGGRFTDSNIPFGVMDLGDISEQELEAAIGLWNDQVAKDDHPEHRILFTGSRGGAKWLPFGYALRDLEAPDLLSRVRLQILGILGVTVNELGEADNVNKANGYNLSFTFKKRAIEPLLDEYTETTTRRLLWEVLDFDDLELYYEDIDSRDELLQAQIDDLHLKSGIVSINQVRNRRGDPSIAGGDEPNVVLGTNAVPVSKLGDFAAVQLEALQMINLQTQVGIAQVLQAMQQPQVDPETGESKPPAPLPPLASLPLLRGMQPPERFTTPLGSGSSTTKFKLPTPNMQQPAPDAAPGTNPQRARGGAQALRNQGVRKEDTSGH